MQDVGYERTLFVASGKQPLLRPGEPPIGAQNPQELRERRSPLALPDKACFRALKSALTLGSRAANSYTSCPTGRVSAIRSTYHPSRHLPPAKVRAFLDFVQEIAP